jgi:ribonuclease BN (tRNA processing enzyme)
VTGGRTGGLSVIALGVGDAFSALSYSSCLAVGADGVWLLVDCPHPIRKILRESGSGLDVGDVAAVVLTHLHADHASGLEGLGYFSHFVLRRRVRLLAHADVLREAWDGHLAAGMRQIMEPEQFTVSSRRLEDYFDVTSLGEERAVTLGPFAIECRRTVHHVPTTAVRIRAGGRALGYSADTAFDPALVEWLAQADLVVHETNAGVHTPYASLAALPAALRARMRLIHYPDDFDAAASVIAPLRQGERIEI